MECIWNVNKQDTSTAPFMLRNSAKGRECSWGESNLLVLESANLSSRFDTFSKAHSWGSQQGSRRLATDGKSMMPRKCLAEVALKLFGTSFVCKGVQPAKHRSWEYGQRKAWRFPQGKHGIIRMQLGPFPAVSSICCKEGKPWRTHSVWTLPCSSW